MRFAKMHGLGNDYIVINGLRKKVPRAAGLARRVADRRFGIGSDGLIIVGPSRKAEFRMTMLNPDGTEAEMCGNGIRCLGKFVYEHKLTRRKAFDVETRAGVKGLKLQVRGGRVRSVSVDMGPPPAVPPRFHRMADGQSRMVPVSIDVNETRFEAKVLSQGNPHCVVFVKDAKTFPVDVYGPVIEKHPDFPSRTNVEFVSWLDAGRVFQRTWERGVGETFACGTGACAVATSLFLPGEVQGKLTVELVGGPLRLEIRDERIFMTGPASTICEGTLSPELLRG
jgi:diaminopimelate epimerase